MFNKLFGAQDKPKAPVVNVEASQEKLDKQIEHIGYRIKKMENDQ